MTMRLLAPIAGAASLIAGFAVAQATGLRWLGGIVVIAGGAWCAWQFYRLAGLARTIAAVTIFAIAFVVSHPLGNVIGAWPAVLVVSVLAALITGVLVRRTSPMSA